MITGNEPANPTDIFEDAAGDRIEYTGLTIRQQFAMAAMQGILSNIDFTDYIPESVAAEAVKAADALIAELNKAES